MSFGFSLGDRLKAAVNNIEAHGHTLQARALGQNHDPASPTASGKSPPAAEPSPLASPAADTRSDTSPTRPTINVLPNGTLAENALLGLRKSFNFRSSSETAKAVTTSTATPGPQELKDIPASAAATGSMSRSSSPARFLNPATFALGSDPSSASATPQQPRSPAPAISISLPKSPLVRPQSKLPLPAPDPEDPATIPLPPSPDLSPVVDTASSARYSDPLGASPLPLHPADDEAPVSPIILQSSIHDGDKEDNNAGAAAQQQPSAPEQAPEAARLSEESGRSLKENGDLSATGSDVAKQLEAAQRKYDELSERFTAILTQKHNADKVLRDLTPLEGGIQDHEALEGWITMMRGKVDMITEEMKRLQDKLNLQDSRMDELRDTHRLEGASQVELIAKLRSQLSTAEINLASKAGDLVQLAQIRADLGKAQTQAKEEEEKRTKAISLLKTVRMKLVKVEKEKEEVEKDRAEERAQRSQAGEEVEKVKADREREVNALRKGFERELASAKERYEKDLQAKKAAWELEMITTKAGHAKEISAKSTKIAGLEAIVKELTVTKNQQFEDLQARQAEAESSLAELEALQNRTKELEFQLREANERSALLEDASASRSGERDGGLGSGVPEGLRAGERSPSLSRQTSYSNMQSSSEVQRLLAEAEARSEAKLSDLRYKIRSLENERNEAEEEWAAKLQERVSELEKLRRTVQEKESEYAESLRTRREKENMIEQREEEKRALEREMKGLRVRMDEIRGDMTVAAEAERAARDDVSSLQIQINTLQSQLEDAKSHSTQLRNNNKTLREEMRKLQSSVQLMERQRNPGVGYWSSVGAGAGAGAGTGAASSSSMSLARSGLTSPEPATPTGEHEHRRSLESTRESVSVSVSTRAGSMQPGRGADSPAPSEKSKDEEEVNLEYLRNVILQFLEHKEMRPNLVRVLSVILRFTPQELRRLNAKLLT